MSKGHDRMMDNPLHGVLLLFIAGLMGGSFYVPNTKVRRWSWETHWLVMGVVAWVTMPALAVWQTVPEPLAVLA